jgi:hypothetical protein
VVVAKFEYCYRNPYTAATLMISGTFNLIALIGSPTVEVEVSFKTMN